MSTTDVGNDYVDHAQLSWHICGRCLAWMGKGDVRWLGLVGCCFPVPDAANAKLYQESMDAGVLKCFRCWERNDDCVVVPKALRGDMAEVNMMLRRIRDNGWKETVPNPDHDAWVAKGEGEVNPHSRTKVVRHGLTDTQMELYKFKIAKICAPLAEQLSRQYKPYASNLHLHNGALDKDDDPEGSMTPTYRDRSKRATYTKNVATKRAEEVLVEQGVKEALGDGGTPRKKNKFGVAVGETKSDVDTRREALQLRIDTLSVKRTKLSGPARGKVTRDINALNAELAAMV